LPDQSPAGEHLSSLSAADRKVEKQMVAVDKGCLETAALPVDQRYHVFTEFVFYLKMVEEISHSSAAFNFQLRAAGDILDPEKSHVFDGDLHNYKIVIYDNNCQHTVDAGW